MSETDAISLAAERGPATRATLVEDLRALGLAAGSTVLVHTSLSRLGWVVGGPVAVLAALSEVVGSGGTLVMPTHTAAMTDPAGWMNPPVPEPWWETIRQETPPFDARTTPSFRMGAVAELFRQSPGVERSDHPVFSFAARGPGAEAIVADHALEPGLGDDSPLGKLYELNASILLLGVKHDNNTSLHLAEIRSGCELRLDGAPVMRDGRRVWARFRMPAMETDDFPAIGKAFAESGGEIVTGRIGSGHGKLMPMRDLVDFATDWMVDNRPKSV